MAYYIRFTDETTGKAKIADAGFTYTDEDGDVHFVTASHDHALDVIGPIYAGGEYDLETGEVITPPSLLPGWHVNFLGNLPEAWEEYVVSPENPIRVFF